MRAQSWADFAIHKTHLRANARSLCSQLRYFRTSNHTAKPVVCYYIEVTVCCFSQMFFRGCYFR